MKIIHHRSIQNTGVILTNNVNTMKPLKVTM